MRPCLIGDVSLIINPTSSIRRAHKTKAGTTWFSESAALRANCLVASKISHCRAPRRFLTGNIGDPKLTGSYRAMADLAFVFAQLRIAARRQMSRVTLATKGDIRAKREMSAFAVAFGAKPTCH